jgi:hypothetical protein
MPRKPRFHLPDVPVHVIQRGNNRQAIFFAPEDYAAYRDWLMEAGERYGCRIHAYVLMTNHVHLLVTHEAEDSIGKTLQRNLPCHVAQSISVLAQHRMCAGKPIATCSRRIASKKSCISSAKWRITASRLAMIASGNRSYRNTASSSA